MPKGKAYSRLLLIMMEPVEETCIPLLSFNSNLLHLNLPYPVQADREIKLQLCFFGCLLFLHPLFSVYLKLTALNSVEFLNAHPSQTPTPFYTYTILHFKLLSSGVLKVRFSKSAKSLSGDYPSPLWGKYRGIGLPLSDTDNSSFLSDKDF